MFQLSMQSRIKKLTNQDKIDLGVTQGLKNHADFVDRINRSINKLSEQVCSLSSNAESVFSKFHSEKKSLEIVVHGLDTKTKKQLEDFNKVLDEFREALKKELCSISISVASVKDKASRMDYLESYNLQLSSSQDNLEEQFKNLKHFVSDYVSEIDKMCGNFFDKKKSEFIDKIPCVEHLEKMLNDKLKEIDVNQKGFLKELEVIKKSVQYGEKKFENIYTLLDRLKEGK